MMPEFLEIEKLTAEFVQNAHEWAEGERKKLRKLGIQA